MLINTFTVYTLEGLAEALMCEPDISTDVTTDAVVALCRIVTEQARQVELLQQQMAQQQAFVSTLRYKAGITPVDELEEMAMAER